MPLAPSSRFGPYDIVAPLGAGGMGEVYRARDSRLGREIAIKVLPEATAADPERLARFEREARLLAALNHPAIASIYGIEESGGVRGIVLELVEGPTLGERLEKGAIPIEDAVSIAKSIALALEYAHEHGIVHRDLKPANIKLVPDGGVKVLDFGLARAFSGDAAEGSSLGLTQSPTLTQQMTAAGIVLGTAAYMAPEQAKGKSVDWRADIWAFGVVLFEMLSGSRVFEGETASETMAAVLKDPVPWERLPADLPARVRGLLERCLERDPRQRLQSIGEARIVLEAPFKSEAAAPRVVAPVKSGRRWIPWAVAALAVVLAAAAVLVPGPEVTLPAATEVSMMLPLGRKLWEDASYHFMAISPDGRAVAYTSQEDNRRELRIRRLDTREDTALQGTEYARNFFFSPDGEWIVFFNTQNMCKVSVHGGTPVEIAPATQDRLGAWLDDGTIVYAPETTTPLFRIPAAGGTPVAVTEIDTTRRERSHRFPSALRGGPWVMFTVGTIDNPGDYDGSTIDAVSVETGERRTLIRGARRAVFAEPGYLVFARKEDLYAVRVDPRDPRVTEEPMPVMSGVAGEASSGASYFAVASDGTLAWVPAETAEDDRRIAWVDRDGNWTLTPVAPGPYLQLSLSPDGTRAIVQAGAGGGSSDLWLADLASGGLNRLTFRDTGGNCIWLSDGSRIVYSRRDVGGETLVEMNVDGSSGGVRELYTATHPIPVTDQTPDGVSVVFSDYGIRGSAIHVLSLEDGTERTLPIEGGSELAPVVSPDNRWVAYITNKTGREEVCIKRLDGTGGSWQVSNGGAGGARWGREGRELFFVTRANVVMRVPVEAQGEGIRVGQPEPLFEVAPSPTEAAFWDYDYDPKTDRFLFTQPPRGVGERREIALSLGWGMRLGEKMGGGKGGS